MYDVKKIPKLPYGQGTISVHNDELLVYKKVIQLTDGTKKRKAVYGRTPKECMEKMAELEHEIREQVKISNDKKTLIDAMNHWLKTVKYPVLKPQSYHRLESIIKNQIGKSEIGHLRYQFITADEIQDVITKLNNDEYSHSTIKKTYDCLNDFYRWSSLRYKFDNPMNTVVMPIVSKINKETKNIVWFEQSDIEKFIKEAGAKYHTGNPKYPGGLAFAANIYLGMRCGELLALQWKDIDFDKNTIYVCKTLIQESNPNYDPRDNNSKKIRFVIQNTNKTSKNRYIPINTKAKMLLVSYKQNCIYTDPEDYIITTRNRKTTTIKNADDTIKKIQLNAETDIQGASSHSLRHTCASLYFRAGVPIETIAKILGHSVDVCRKTYLHFVEEQMKDAASKIDVIEI